MYDNIIGTFLESDARANTISIIRHKGTREAGKSDEEYIYCSFTIEGTKEKISPVTLRNKGKQTDPKICVFTSGDEIGLVKIVDEAQEWFKENNVNLDEYLGSSGKGLVG
jgi:hypothetical protein